jgi:hypothetical protein
MSLEEIKSVSEISIRSILKESISKKALQYLTEKQGSKGGEINYPSLKMADYLLPSFFSRQANAKLSLSLAQHSPAFPFFFWLGLGLS